MCYNINRRCGLTINLLILALLGLFIYFGYRQGFLKDFFLIFGVCVGISQIGRYLDRVVALFSPFLPIIFCQIIALLIIIFFFAFLFQIIAFIIYGLFNRIRLGWLDSILGGIWGFVKGMVLTWFLLILTLNIFPESRERIFSSELSIRVLAFGEIFHPLLKKTGIERHLTNLQKLVSLLKSYGRYFNRQGFE